MCDTVVALGNVTADGVTLFGKNSDREPNEAQYILRVPAARHPPGSTVKCTYVEIPQVEQTYEVLLSKPFWMWGAEMGANEHGVAIGNEAVFTKAPVEKGAALLGMDLLRLALERARTAREALDVITGLLAAHGQGGNHGFEHKAHYHNSYLIADPHAAWVLETAGRQWAAEQVRGARAISNGITIGERWDLASEDLVRYAVERGWCQGRDDFHFGRCYSDFLYTTFGKCRQRQSRATQLLQEKRGKLTVEDVLQILRDHGPNAGPDWTPARGLMCFEICNHAGPWPVRVSQTTGSMVSHLAPGVQTHYLTGTAAPCTSLFKPLWLGTDTRRASWQLALQQDEDSLFWRHERLHRATLRDYATRLALYRDERDELEGDFIRGAQALVDQPLAERAAYSTRCFELADEAEARWTERVREAPVRRRPGLLYTLAWRGIGEVGN
jgi:dipeptidase